MKLNSLKKLWPLFASTAAFGTTLGFAYELKAHDPTVRYGLRGSCSEAHKTGQQSKARTQVDPNPIGPCADGVTDACLTECISYMSTSYRDKATGETKCVDPSSSRCFNVNCTRISYSMDQCPLDHLIGNTTAIKKACR